ncbi:LutB/LldF family L-lactate oxidation iron-sulfur protein [Halomonas sp. McH1-25]|uniref:LutB/LldF family L-lactate oxidation iron-sulfur protein n=1 Tax=unclassified Halomonas TaxID=2609666 RepID=UPI001EF6BE4B|nr:MULTISPECIES: LutB/LldF family L-lactate oxidation iron-sulfur protein [unclassified Halomonas]MCG7600015.1 LutB/LldF family L-lactate oxidation iron-sulfur protein [Halomonas sp. McH1-25]MCP1344051.1 LutB/LldF family L-lactate oxidation iron-sulfur protein [Halomonas sp. FL8]MCP1363441.1 LutB/LldF family L-lactate oxidation iron-sulfur protein [Halomonas sp. BBD45]
MSFQSDSPQIYTPQAFHRQAHDALGNPQIRSNFRRAMDGLMSKRREAFGDWDLETLRELGANIRLRALAKLPDLLEQLETNCQANGIRVHWAEDGEQACRIIRDLCEARGARHVIKGKSMVSEEMHLNDHLQAAGIEALESDLGEYLVQLNEQTPSHIIMPAIHLNTEEISDVMHDRTGTERTTDVDYLTAAARAQLRERFMAADVGISGVNFAVAETGTLCLVENEGNGRMTTTVPPVHIAVTGIEKVVEHLRDVPPLYALLTRSATGQHVTTYFNMISGPRKPGERDGPEEVHLVLVDNGRSSIYQDNELLDTLRCIRCGACMNHCPVYTRVGGHTYGTTYPGPIGSILMPHLMGLEATKDLPSASSLCGACGEVCPVKIPIPDLLVRLRKEAVGEGRGNVEGAGAKRDRKEALAWKGWQWLATHPGAWRAGTGVAGKFRTLSPSRLGTWTDCREAPKPAGTSLHALVKQHRRKVGREDEQ